MDEKILEMAREVVEEIEKLPEDATFTLGEFMMKYKLDNNGNFNLIKAILMLCKEKNIELENLQEDMELGMPWVFQYRKK